MKKALCIPILLSCLLGYSLSQAQAPSPKNLFFVIDVSGSMTQNKIFEPLKKEITGYIKKEANKGDFVSIITFGTDVKLIASERISHESTATDISRLIEMVNKLTAREQHTHMTKALDLLASQMALVKAGDPKSLIKAYLFTDGKNDPPPGAEGADWTFDQILKKHYDVFDNPATYLFVITLGIEPDEALVRAAEEMKGKVFINTVPDVSDLEEMDIFPEEPPIVETPPEDPKVSLEISGPGQIKAKPKTRYNLLIHIRELNKEAVSKILNFRMNFAPPLDFSYDITEIKLEKRTKVKIPIALKNPPLGEYSLRINFDSAEHMIIDPSEYEKIFSIKKPNYIPLFALLAILIIAGAVAFIIRSIPRFSDDHIVVDTKAGLKYELKEKQKWHSATVTSKDLGIDDQDFRLKINKKTGDVHARILIDGEWTDTILKSGDMIVDPYKYEIRMS